MPQVPDTSTWTKLKTQIYNSGRTASELSVVTGIPWVRFSQAQQGRRKLTSDEYERIAKIIKVAPLDLIGFNDPDFSLEVVESPGQRSGRLRREREAMTRLRKNNLKLYNYIVYGKTQPEEVGDDGGGNGNHEAASAASNGSRG